MRLTMIVPIVQLMGVLIPLIGCIVMFRREQIKASMSRVFTNMSPDDYEHRMFDYECQLLASAMVGNGRRSMDCS